MSENLGSLRGTHNKQVVEASFGLEGGILVPGHCILATFIIRVPVVVPCGGPKTSPRTYI